MGMQGMLVRPVLKSPAQSSYKSWCSEGVGTIAPPRFYSSYKRPVCPLPVEPDSDRLLPIVKEKSF